MTCLGIYLIYQNISGFKRKNYGFLFLACTFLPALFLNNMVYNDILALSLFIYSIYFSILHIRTQRLNHLLISSVLLGIGNIFRPVGIIYLIAIIINYGFNYHKILKIKQKFIAVTVFVFIFMLPSNILFTSLKAAKITDELSGTNAPSHWMYINMGIPSDKFLGFYDNGTSLDIYTNKSNSNRITSDKIFKQSIKEKLSRFSAYELVKQYFKKAFWLWTEGNYQSEFYGLGNHLYGGYVYHNPINSLFAEGSNPREFLKWIIYISNIIFLIMTVIFTMYLIKNYDINYLLPILVILGFLAFYIIWETKSRYLFTCYPFLLILFYAGFNKVYELIITKQI